MPAPTTNDAAHETAAAGQRRCSRRRPGHPTRPPQVPGYAQARAASPATGAPAYFFPCPAHPPSASCVCQTRRSQELVEPYPARALLTCNTRDPDVARVAPARPRAASLPRKSDQPPAVSCALPKFAPLAHARPARRLAAARSAFVLGDCPLPPVLWPTELLPA